MKKLFVILIIFLHYGYLQSQIFQWDEPIRISNNPEGWCILPSICDDNYENLYVAFSHFNHDENNHLYFTWFDGVNWQGVDTLYNNLYHDSYDTKILCDNENNLHLSAAIAYGAFGRVYYMKRVDNIWSELIQISIDSLGNNWDHDMTIDQSGKVYIFFQTKDIYYRTISDTVISDVINITNLTSEQFSALEPSVAINNSGTIYLAYKLKDELMRESDIYYQSFNGIQWSEPQNISQIDGLSVYEPNISVDHLNNPHIVWRQEESNLYNIFHSSRFKGEWTTPVNISVIPNVSSYRPKIKIYRNKPLVFYHTINENDDTRSNYYSYHLDEVWSITQFDIGINTSLHFDYIISNSDTLHFVTRSSPVSNRADIEYIKGYNEPTYINEFDTEEYESLNIKVYPNPFNNNTKIQFSLDNPDQINIKVFDITGRLVKTIISDHNLTSGLHLFYWDGSNDIGKGVSSGIYVIAFIRKSELVKSGKILLFK